MDGAALRGKRVMVVGGTRGIGRAIAAACLAAGAEVLLTGRDAARAQAVAAELATASGGKARGYGLELGAADVEARVNALLDAAAPLDALCYNAGVSPAYARADRISTGIWHEVLSVNLTAAFFVARAYGAGRIAAGGAGALLLVASVAGVVGAQRLAAYGAAKSGLVGLARSLALDWAEYGIRVNALAPGWVATDLTAGLREHAALRERLEAQVPLGRFATPEEIAPAAVFLLSDAARYVTGAVYAVDGGLLAA